MRVAAKPAAAILSKKSGNCANGFDLPRFSYEWMTAGLLKPHVATQFSVPIHKESCHGLRRYCSLV